MDAGGNARPLYLIVGEHRVSPCDRATFGRFKLWVATRLGGGKIDHYSAPGVDIEHWDSAAAACSPHLLNPCECGTYLPIEVEPGPMLSSAIGLIEELYHLNQFRDEMEPDFQNLVDGLWKMAQLSIATNGVLEIR